MSKRSADVPVSPGGLKNHSRESAESNEPSSTYNPAMGEFEDQFEDEFESEDEILEAGADGNPDPDSDGDDGAGEADADGDTNMDIDGDEKKAGNGKKKSQEEVYLPSRRTLGKDEILEPDPTAYHMLHRMNVTWPCLSFDVLRDGLGEERRGYPATTYLVTGTQAEQSRKNEIMVLKLSGLNKMQRGMHTPICPSNCSSTYI